jgi:hypothetical protein
MIATTTTKTTFSMAAIRALYLVIATHGRLPYFLFLNRWNKEVQKKAVRTNKKQDEPFIHLAFWAKNMHSLIGFVHKRLSFSSKSLLI